MKKLILCLLLLCLSACGGSVPKDWEIISKEEATKYYRRADFTVDNVKDYFKIVERTEKNYNSWNELETVEYQSVISLDINNGFMFDTIQDFQIEIKVQTKRYKVKLDPVTLEELEIIENANYEEYTFTVAGVRENLATEYYRIPYNQDGSVKTNDDGDLIISKKEIVDWEVLRVKGTLEWVQDIDSKYIMSSNEHTEVDHWGGGEVVFVVFEGEDYYYCYEQWGDKEYVLNRWDPQTYGFKGNSFFVVGNTESFASKR